MFVFCCCLSSSVLLKSVVTKEVTILHSSKATLTIIQRKWHYEVCKSSKCTITVLALPLCTKIDTMLGYVPLDNGLLFHTQALPGLVFVMHQTQEVVKIMIILYSI